MAFSSPEVNVREIDLSQYIPSAVNSSGGSVAPFKWGPILERTLVTGQENLVSLFGPPVLENNTYWFSAASFLAYSNSLFMVRAASTGFLNAISDNTKEAIQIKNDIEWDDNYSMGGSDVGPFAARFAGDMGNSLLVSVADSASYETWEYKYLFDTIPETSSWVEQRGGSNDEMHMVVIDRFGKFTNTPNSVLEIYPFVSKASDAKYPDGDTAYYKNVLRNRSSYIHWMAHIPNVENIGTSSIGTHFGNILDGWR
jgi:hypothetical protein